MSRIAIIGAGPIGLEAALLARQLGHDVQVFEKDRVAENILDWGHVRLFSPFGMNSSEWGRGAIAKTFGSDTLPRFDELLTGHEFVTRYLGPLSRLPELNDRIHSRCEAISIGRTRFSKRDGIGQPARAADPFRLLFRRGDVEVSDEVVEADVVLDCSGTYPHHNWLGAGGMMCPGEQTELHSEDYRLTPITAERFAGQTTLIVGAGYSAATSVVALADLSAADAATRVLWLTRPRPDGSYHRDPIDLIPDDPLTGRDGLARRANELIRGEDSPVNWLPNSHVQSIIRNPASQKLVVHIERLEAWQGGGRREELVVDRLIANVGYRPDRSIYEELHVHECYATQGPIKLAAKLLGETSADCLAQTSHGCDVLKNPEPNFFILGSKSYGRNSNFLLRVGIEQVREVLFSLSSAKESP